MLNQELTWGNGNGNDLSHFHYLWLEDTVELTRYRKTKTFHIFSALSVYCLGQPNAIFPQSNCTFYNWQSNGICFGVDDKSSSFCFSKNNQFIYILDQSFSLNLSSSLYQEYWRVFQLTESRWLNEYDWNRWTWPKSW